MDALKAIFNWIKEQLLFFWNLKKKIAELENKDSRAMNCPNCDSRMHVFHSVSRPSSQVDEYWYRCTNKECSAHQRHIKVMHKAK